jgi:hypothetical protein
MKAGVRAAVATLVILALGVGWYTVAADYGDGVVAGSYRLSGNGETSTLLLKPDHTFEQVVTRAGGGEHAEGGWRRLGEGGITFTDGFLHLAGAPSRPAGGGVGDIRKPLGVLVSIEMRQYYVVDYNRTGSYSSSSVVGAYEGYGTGMDGAKLELHIDHTFDQSVGLDGHAIHAHGSWKQGPDGGVVFSSDFLKPFGEPLAKDENATSLDPKDYGLQIEVASTLPVPTYRKRQVPW